jgi:hypothetical protein
MNSNALHWVELTDGMVPRKISAEVDEVDISGAATILEWPLS